MVVVDEVRGAVAVVKEVVCAVFVTDKVGVAGGNVVGVTSGGISVGDDEGIPEIVKKEDDGEVVGSKVPDVTIPPTGVVGLSVVVFWQPEEKPKREDVM